MTVIINLESGEPIVGALPLATVSSNGLMSAANVTTLNNALPISGGTLTGSVHGGGNAIDQFDSGHTTSDVALTSDASAAVLAVTISGLTASHTFSAVLGVRVHMYLDSAHSTCGPIDMLVGLAITTNGTSVASCTLQPAVPVPDTSMLPAGLSGATATVAASAGGFTISASRFPGANCHARAKYWIMSFEDVT